MTEFFAPENAPFAVALCLVALIALVEIAGLLLGFSASGAIDSQIDSTPTPISTRMSRRSTSMRMRRTASVRDRCRRFSPGSASGGCRSWCCSSSSSALSG
jgi:hypothetical protein